MTRPPKGFEAGNLLDSEGVPKRSNETLADELIEQADEPDDWVSKIEAEEIFGDDCLGPGEVEAVFGAIPENLNVYPIPFSRKELLQAKQLGQQLVFQSNVMINSEGNEVPLSLAALRERFPHYKDRDPIWSDSNDWFEDEPFYLDETPRAGWKLVSQKPIRYMSIPAVHENPRNYISEMHAILAYVETTVFKDVEMPDAYKAAIEEFDTRHEELKTQLESANDDDVIKAVQELSDLQVTQCFRERPVEVLYRLVLNNQLHGIRHPLEANIWCNTVINERKFVEMRIDPSSKLNLFDVFPWEAANKKELHFTRMAPVSPEA